MRFLALLLFAMNVEQPLLSAPRPGVDGADRSVCSPCNEITSANIVVLMNEYRAERGLAPLHEDARLTMAAHDRVRHMEELGYWAHSAPDGMSPFVWLSARDYAYSSAAENLASGFETVRLLVQSWMESPGHRENILTPEFADCGIAIIDGATTGPATGKSIVVLFGAPRDRAVILSEAKDPHR